MDRIPDRLDIQQSLGYGPDLRMYRSFCIFAFPRNRAPQKVPRRHQEGSQRDKVLVNDLTVHLDFKFSSFRLCDLPGTSLEVDISRRGQRSLGYLVGLSLPTADGKNVLP